jgi:hypothetical protein
MTIFLVIAASCLRVEWFDSRRLNGGAGGHIFEPAIIYIRQPRAFGEEISDVINAILTPTICVKGDLLYWGKHA